MVEGFWVEGLRVRVCTGLCGLHLGAGFKASSFWATRALWRQGFRVEGASLRFGGPAGRIMNMAKK